jgi:hypothetical protein
MARIRTIKPEIWEDELFGTLSRDAQLVFIGLISQADDDGRQRGAAALLRSALWPYNPPEISEVESWLAELIDSGMVIQYEVDRQTYLQINNWKKHQRVQKHTPSKLPPPAGGNFSGGLRKTPEDYANPGKPAQTSGVGTFPEDSGTDQERDQDQEEDQDQELTHRAREAAIVSGDFARQVEDLWSNWPPNRRPVDPIRLGDLLAGAGVTAETMPQVTAAFEADSRSPDWRDGVIPNLTTWVERRSWIRAEVSDDPLSVEALERSPHPADQAAAGFLRAIPGGAGA